MKYQPLVSIIIPVYNGSNYLSQAIDAAINQTYKNTEILIVNDGSTDNGETEKIALSYGNRICYFAKENCGVSSALNFAFTKMKGEWFSWLSHDDLYYPDKIEKQIIYINKLIEENPKLDIHKITVRTATESIDKDGKVIRIPNYADISDNEEPINTMLNNVFNYRLSGCSFLLPSTCVADVGNFNEKIRTVSDVEYWYRLLFSGYRFYCMKNNRLVKNRSHRQQVGKTKVLLFENEMNDLFITIADKFAQVDQYNTKGVFIKYYMALLKRHCQRATQYVKKQYLKNMINPVQYYVVLPISGSFYWLQGSIRNIARKTYRKIKVK